MSLRSIDTALAFAEGQSPEAKRSRVDVASVAYTGVSDRLSFREGDELRAAVRYRILSATQTRAPLTWADVLALLGNAGPEGLSFHLFFCSLLASAPFSHFYFCTAPLSSSTLHSPFSMAVVDAGAKQGRLWDEGRLDRGTFAPVVERRGRCDPEVPQAVAFPAGDPKNGPPSTFTTLVCPSDDCAYPYLSPADIKALKLKKDLVDCCASLALPSDGTVEVLKSRLKSQSSLCAPSSCCLHLSLFVRSASALQKRSLLLKLAQELRPKAASPAATYVSTDGTEVHWLHVHVSTLCKNHHLPEYKPLCRFFQTSTGGCRYGDECNYRHAQQGEDRDEGDKAASDPRQAQAAALLCGHQGQQLLPCTFFRSKGGCRKGSSCSWRH